MDYFSQADIPVLKRTMRELGLLHGNEAEVIGRQLATVILRDPLLTLRVLAYIEAHRGKRQTADITTIDHAVMMLGITSFFTELENLPLVEDKIKEQSSPSSAFCA